MKHLVAIVDARFDNSVRAGGQMQFSGQAACVAGVSKESADELLVGWHRLAILATLCCSGISSGQECRAARCANRALCVGLGERDPLANQFVDARRVDVGIAKRTNCVVALLVSANPEDVRSLL